MFKRKNKIVATMREVPEGVKVDIRGSGTSYMVAGGSTALLRKFCELVGKTEREVLEVLLESLEDEGDGDG